MKNIEWECILQRKKRILIYGIGNQFKECYKIFREKEVVFFDGNSEKWGTVVYGNLIHSPQEIKQYFDENSILIIGCIFSQYEIATYLTKEYDIPKDSIFMYTSPWYEAKVYDYSKVQANWKRIEKCCANLADEESKVYYMNSLRARCNRNPFFLMPNPNSRVVGEYGNIIKLNKGESILDCGAYIGDTAEMYLKRLDGNCKVYAIEPFEENYVQMKQLIKENGWDNKVFPFLCAVGNEKKQNVFGYNDDDFGMAINMNRKEGEKVQVVKVDTIDNMFADKEITYIKMDIEGEEKNALEGAENIIKKYSPKLMISAYHKIEDFWELPEKIWSLDGNYKIYVGHAPNVSTELEFYCLKE